AEERQCAAACGPTDLGVRRSGVGAGRLRSLAAHSRDLPLRWVTSRRSPAGAVILGNRGVRVGSMTMPARRGRWVALAAASALLATGCSSSDDDPKADAPSSSSQSPTESPSESPSESPDSATGTDGKGDDADGGDDGTIGGRPTLEPSEVPTK